MLHSLFSFRHLWFSLLYLQSLSHHRPNSLSSSRRSASSGSISSSSISTSSSPSNSCLEIAIIAEGFIFFDCNHGRRLRSQNADLYHHNQLVSMISTSVLSSLSTFTSSPRDCSSFNSTLKDSGIPGSGMFSPLMMAS